MNTYYLFFIFIFYFVFLIGQLKAGSLHFEGDCHGFFSTFYEFWLGHRHGRGVRTKARALWQQSLVKKGLVFFFFFPTLFIFSWYARNNFSHFSSIPMYPSGIRSLYSSLLPFLPSFYFMLFVCYGKEQQSPRIQSKVSYKA